MYTRGQPYTLLVPWISEIGFVEKRAVLIWIIGLVLMLGSGLISELLRLEMRLA